MVYKIDNLKPNPPMAKLKCSKYTKNDILLYFMPLYKLTVNILICLVAAFFNSQDQIAKGDIAYIQTAICQNKKSHSLLVSCFGGIFF